MKLRFKNKRDEKMFAGLHPILLGIYIDLFLYVKNKYDVELVVTDTISTPLSDRLLGRKSKQHQRGLAIDIRTRDLDAFIIEDILKYLNYHPEHKKHKYLSRSGKERLAYYHVGTAEHLHVAIHARYATQ